MCGQFVENIEKINAPFMLAAARNPDTNKGYDGARFKFCPWCGAKLMAQRSNSDTMICLPTNDASQSDAASKLDATTVSEGASLTGNDHISGGLR